ncbi:MAG: GGDEF domain-containing protein, partial [Chloroflexota bacterium]
AQLVEKARKLSITDGVTGLSNRRHFHEVLSIEMSRARRTGRPLSVVLVDLDGFRQYNELFGQTNGDKVLRSLGETLVSSLRKIDVVFRVGSDEFAVLFPATDSCRAKKAMKRIRLKWTGEHEAENQALDVPLSFSTGIAQFPENAQTSESLLFLADFALRQSKQNGGQRCTSASELGELPTPTPQWAGVGQL